MLERALALAQQGFLVFPLAPGAKSPPLVNDWPHFATTAEGQIKDWWERWPQANIGIHCDGLIVIDVDPKKGGYESLEALEKQIQLDATLEVETPSGGRHIFYRCSSDVRNGVDVLGPGLDVRAARGYVVGAGSYTRAGENQSEGTYRVVVDEPIADAPQELVERLYVRQEPAAPREGAETDPDAAVQRAVEYLRTHPVATEGQGGDHHTFRTVCRIRDFGVPEERAAEALAEWNERCIPPWLPEDLAFKIHNAYRYAQDVAGKLTPEALGFSVVIGADRTQNEYNRTQNEYKGDTTELLHPADVELDSVLSAEYLIKGVIERQSNVVAFGQWNVGKTFVVLDMAAAIATGERWFGRRVRQGRVLYLGYEGLRAMKKRMIALRGRHPKLLDRNVPFEWQPLRTALTKPEGVAALGAVLTAYAKRHGGAPDLIIIDPLANAIGGDDSDAMMMGLLNECVAALIQKQRCTVLRVHHSGHGNQDRARGHSSLPAGVDTEIRVTQDEIALTKQRDDVRGKFFFKLDVVKLGRDNDGDDVTTCTISQVEDGALSPELSGPQRALLDALIALRGDGGHVSKTDMRDATPDADATLRREMIRVLERKQYLRVEGVGWVICERGPAQIFD
jgi:Bifunctional DNA primase/polymerase, N-terminal/AAA domain